LHPSNNYEAIDLGGELNIRDMLFLRAGFSSLGQSDSIEGLSVGGGLVIPTEFGKIHFDYGYRDYGDLGYIQAMTIGFSL